MPALILQPISPRIPSAAEEALGLSHSQAVADATAQFHAVQLNDFLWHCLANELLGNNTKNEGVEG
jgi:hypothetical protein